jgi:cell division protein FtsI/penicillin-binding protein 2
VVVDAAATTGVKKGSGPLLAAILASLVGLAVLPAEATGAHQGDAAFQAACERLVGSQPISIVALEPKLGRLRALVHPELATQPHPPGSVFKLVTGLAAIETGVAPPTKEFKCAGAYRPPHAVGIPLPCWKPGGHGQVALEEAIALSCNVTFYQLAEKVGYERLSATALRGGLATAPGWLRPPADATALARMGIGEGAGIAITAEQLAAFVAAIATDGAIRKPDWTPTAASNQVLAAPATLKRLRAGMRAAVVHGSARNAACRGLSVAGKTGTATYTDGTNRTYGWFAGFAPAEHPAVAIVIFEREGTGFGGAAKLGGRVFEAWMAAGRP